MKVTNDTHEERAHGGYVIAPGETLEVDSAESADWLIRHGCTAADAPPKQTKRASKKVTSRA